MRSCHVWLISEITAAISSRDNWGHGRNCQSLKVSLCVKVPSGFDDSGDISIHDLPVLIPSDMCQPLAGGV